MNLYTKRLKTQVITMTSYGAGCGCVLSKVRHNAASFKHIPARKRQRLAKKYWYAALSAGKNGGLWFV